MLERFQVTLAQWCERCRASAIAGYVALVGDRSDGIPGILGVGRKRAATMLAGGLHLEDLESAGRLTGAHGRRVSDQYQQAIRSRSLIRLRTDAHLSIYPSGRPTPELPLAAHILEERQIW